MSRTGFRKLLPLLSTLALIMPLLLALASPVSAATLCVKPGGPGACYASIQAAVDAANDGDVIDVYPGTYNESVVLDNMNVPGALTVRTVNASGGYEPHTATVDGGASGDALRTNGILPGDLTIEGFVVLSDNDDGIDVAVNSAVVIRDVIANGTGSYGVGVQGASGNVTIEDCTANDNADNGFDLESIDGNLTVTRCTANDNDDENFDIDEIGGNVTITNSTANRSDDDEGFDLYNIDGDVKITGCTANDNDGDGIFVNDIAGNLEISNCTAIGNGGTGTDPIFVYGDVRITDSVFRLNTQEGVDLDALDDADLGLVNGNIICGNECGVRLETYMPNLEGNWWGCDGGPYAAGCDPICQDDSVQVDYTPWIDTVTASAPASVMVGNPALVSFQFSGGPPAVYLGEGPGDLHGDPTFVVTTDNGTVTDPGFINAPDGVLEVTLVPDHGGTATVWVHGPCGLDDSVVLGVEAEFVPEPGSVALLASGLMGLAGYAGLRLRKK